MKLSCVISRNEKINLREKIITTQEIKKGYKKIITGVFSVFKLVAFITRELF